MPVARRLSLILGTLAVLLATVAPAGAQSQVMIEEVRVAAGSRSAPVGVSPGPCNDGAYKLLGGRWTRTYRWSFKRSSTPAGLNRAAVAGTLTRSFSNVTDARNDCGRPDNVGATHEYLGVTTRSPNCRSRDGFNVVGFGRMDFGVLAVTCFWISNGRIIEADMRINNRESWALSASGCTGDRPMLEATITHEEGHVFGLDHVGERRHGRLTMSPFIDGPCNNNEATLGRGDMLGLEQIY
jgi:hypothetical protein